MLPVHWIFLALLSLGYAVALAYGQLDATALYSLAMLLLAALAVRPERPLPVRCAGHVLFIATGLGLALHLLPGFHNARVFDQVQLSAQALPYSMNLNLDKPLIGFWLLLAYPWLLRPQPAGRWLQVAALALLLTAPVCLGLAWALGSVAWAPKWPANGGLWLLNNLLLVSVTEELLFRAYLQTCIKRMLDRLVHHRLTAELMAIGLSAGLFGLAHAGLGGHWVLLASIAGLGYATAWRLGGLPAAVAVHAGVNLTHFGLFTYPMMAL